MTDYFDLGVYSRPITTTSADAQLWFDRGLNWTYGYNHAEAIACFEKALLADPNCVMAHWGICYAIGPNYNYTWPDFPYREKQRAVKTFAKHCAAALANLDNATLAERGLVTAIAARNIEAAEIEDFTPFTDAYADAMRKLYTAHPTDLDICGLTAEALMGRTPWLLWDLKTGLPKQGADTAEAVTIMETAFHNHPDAMRHPGLLHMYIHNMEMSPHPERALRMGDALTGLVPDAGHLQHMATHVDVLCGQYENVVRRNARAWEADQKFIATNGTANFYTTYICHDLHFQLYGAMFLGQIAPALDAAEALENLLTPDVVEPAADWIESYYPMRLHALIRFGRWQDIADYKPPQDAELFAFTHAVTQYAKAVACAASGDIAGAERHRAAFYPLRDAVPETRVLFNNLCSDILAIAADMLEGELAYRKGDFDTAFAHLRNSANLDDNLPYEEPWGWMQPTRHALGALLLEQGHVEEAEAVYRADLGLDGKLSRACQNPDNVWSLHGLHECLVKTGQGAEALLIKQRLDIANARADAPIKASCTCRLSH
jgi:tetratricopeptide (TPR) repeat protein